MCHISDFLDLWQITATFEITRSGSVSSWRRERRIWCSPLRTTSTYCFNDWYDSSFYWVIAAWLVTQTFDSAKVRLWASLPFVSSPPYVTSCIHLPIYTFAHLELSINSILTNLVLLLESSLQLFDHHPISKCNDFLVIELILTAVKFNSTWLSGYFLNIRQFCLWLSDRWYAMNISASAITQTHNIKCVQQFTTTHSSDLTQTTALWKQITRKCKTFEIAPGIVSIGQNVENPILQSLSLRSPTSITLLSTH
jgi:hypothetical protein